MTEGHFVECDKCGKNEDMENGGESIYILPEGWTNLREHGDLCPSCSDAFDKAVQDFIKEK